MAYNSYYPATYVPAYQQSFYPAYTQPVVSAPVAQPQQQTQSYSPATNQTGIIWISGASEAQMYPIAPNNAVALWEQSGKTIYLKRADATGKPTITVYDLVERKMPEPTSSAGTETKAPTYATKDDISAVAGVVKDLDESISSFRDSISSLRGEIDSIKSDMYGIAGKKKAAAKRNEVDDDE